MNNLLEGIGQQIRVTILSWQGRQVNFLITTSNGKIQLLFQYKVYKNTREIPVELKATLDEKTLEKSRAYQIDRSRFGFFSSFYSQIESTVSCF